MKKFYSTLAIAAVMSASAFATASVPSMVPADENLANAAYEMTDFNVGGSLNAKSTVAPKDLSSVDQVCNVYNFSDYKWMLSNDDPGIPTASIYAVEGNTIQIIFGAYSHFPITGTVDTAAGTIKITTADNKNVYYAESLGKYLSLEIRVPGADGKVTEQASEMTVKVQADGTINLNGYAIMACWGGNSYNFGFYAGVLKPFNKWTFKSSEWDTLSDKALLEEYVFNPAYSQAVPPQETTMMVNKADNTKILLYKPYATEGWTQRNSTANDEGFLYIDLSNKDCVLLRPIVFSGFTLSYSTGEKESMYPYNNEGYKVYLDGYTCEELIEEVELTMDDNEKLSDYLSSYDASANKLSIINCVFGNATNPIAGYVWQSVKDLYYKVGLPQSYVPGAINEVEVDANAPVKYYNLQGVEIANPAAGEIVIAKQGAKVSKVIVK